MIAWKLIVAFDEQKHLFYEKIQTAYLIEAYICSCSSVEFIIKNPEQTLEYRCKTCKNTNFYSANYAWSNSRDFVEKYKNLHLTYEYVVKNDCNSVNSVYTTSIPKSIDFLKGKILFAKKTLHSLTITREGELQENYFLQFDKEVAQTVAQNLTHYINKNNCFDLPMLKDKELSLTAAIFFLKNRHLREFEFYFWDDIDELPLIELSIEDALGYVSHYRSEKSVKRSVYQNYLQQLVDNKKYNFTFVEVFCKNIKDSNILSMLLQLKLKPFLYKDISRDGLREMIIFLKQYYLEKQIAKLFISTESESTDDLFRDAICEFYENRDVIKRTFKKVACNIRSLHDEIIRCLMQASYKAIQNKKLAYSKESKKFCVSIDSYKIQLPKNGQELYDWAQKLHNCMAGYFQRISSRETILYCFFQENTPKFAVEISDGKIIQASGVCNDRLSSDENDILSKWHERFFQKKSVGT